MSQRRRREVAERRVKEMKCGTFNVFRKVEGVVSPRERIKTSYITQIEEF